MSRQTNNQQAVVLGGSMAGLLTARILSDHFDHVTIVERDPVHAHPEARKGQPQARHLHGLLASGLAIMNQYFPGLSETLAAEGAFVGDMGESMNWYTYGGYRQRFTFGHAAALMSRPLLEYTIRQRVLALNNVTLLDNSALTGWVATQDHQRITGVCLERRGDTSELDTLVADLVVDCSGRGSRTPHWLVPLGYAAPQESEVKVDVGYATRVYQRDPADPRGQQWMLYTPQAPQEMRFGGMFPIEGNRWIVSMGGWIGDHAPTDEAGFLAYARSLPMPDIYDVISQAEPLGEIMAHKFNASLRRHYEKLTRFPEGLLVLGDAVCSFNPTYGQGMTSAAMQAAVLDQLLTQRYGNITALAQPFFQRIARVIDTPWQLAVGEDFRFPATTGPRPAGIDLLNRYVATVHRATLLDPIVGKAFMRVMNLLAPPSSLMTPAMLLRVWRANQQLKNQRAQAPQHAAPAPSAS